MSTHCVESGAGSKIEKSRQAGETSLGSMEDEQGRKERVPKCNCGSGEQMSLTTQSGSVLVNEATMVLLTC